MSDKLSQASSGDADGTAELQLRLTDWLWARWYAKCWWALIPVYWLAIGEPTRPAILEAFARSGYAVITHMIFNPVVAFIVLGAGYFRRAAREGGLEPIDYDPSSGFSRLPGAPSALFDGSNPRSGPHWIGSRLKG